MLGAVNEMQKLLEEKSIFASLEHNFKGKKGVFELNKKAYVIGKEYVKKN